MRAAPPPGRPSAAGSPDLEDVFEELDRVHLWVGPRHLEEPLRVFRGVRPLGMDAARARALARRLADVAPAGLEVLDLTGARALSLFAPGHRVRHADRVPEEGAWDVVIVDSADALRRALGRARLRVVARAADPDEGPRDGAAGAEAAELEAILAREGLARRVYLDPAPGLRSLLEAAPEAPWGRRRRRARRAALAAWAAWRGDAPPGEALVVADLAPAPPPVEPRAGPCLVSAHAPPAPGLASVVVPIYNNLPLTRRCLAALLAATDRPFEVVVVDNGSCDGTAAFLDATAGLTVVRHAENRGFAAACNAGARAARGEWLVLLNNDTEPRQGWLRPLVAALEAGAGAAGSLLVYGDGGVQHAGLGITPGGDPFHPYGRRPLVECPGRVARAVQAVTGACLATPRALYLQEGGLDEGYRNGFEDLDYCLRLGRSGHRVVYEPASVVLHHEGATPGRHRRDRENAALFLARWADSASPDASLRLVRDLATAALAPGVVPAGERRSRALIARGEAPRGLEEALRALRAQAAPAPVTALDVVVTDRLAPGPAPGPVAEGAALLGHSAGLGWAALVNHAAALVPPSWLAIHVGRPAPHGDALDRAAGESDPAAAGLIYLAAGPVDRWRARREAKRSGTVSPARGSAVLVRAEGAAAPLGPILHRLGDGPAPDALRPRKGRIVVV
ncbi:MAG: glycosyltransferase [Planctomycetes bacterium]|nr:glycosyltransferase [Planctomycetota bacterium]